MKANEAPDFPEKVYIPRDPEYPQSPNIWWERESSDGELTEFEKALAEIIHHAQGSVLSPEGIAVSNSYALLSIAEKEIRRKIWHDASEEPVEEEFPIIVIDAANCVYLIDKDDTEPFDSEDKWLSVHDILPRKENRL